MVTAPPQTLLGKRSPRLWRPARNDENPRPVHCENAANRGGVCQALRVGSVSALMSTLSREWALSESELG